MFENVILRDAAVRVMVGREQASVQTKRGYYKMKRFLTVATVSLITATAALAESEEYVLDPSHSQILFSYNHMGYSTTWGMFSGFEGSIMYDKDNPAESSVEVSMPVMSMFTGWEGRFKHFMNEDFFDATPEEEVTFKSTSIEVTGDQTAKITGDLTLNGVTKSIVLDAEMNKSGKHPMKPQEWLGFNADTVIKRSDFNLGKFAPNVSDEVDVEISIEAGKVDNAAGAN